MTELCALAGVSRSGYYRWVAAIPAKLEREKQDREDFQRILDVYNYRGYRKGVRSIYARLFRLGKPMNKKKIRRLMRKYGLLCPIRKANPYRRLAKALKTDATAENALNREFFEHGPRKFLLTDITYLRLNGSFCYLSVITDCYTSEVLAYQLSESLEIQFVLDTVNQLIRDHGMTLDSKTYIHSDQGCHYTSVSFRNLLKEKTLMQSMSRKGNCWDNAPQESFFGHMKDELKPQMKHWETIENVQASIDDWMDYYNNERYRSDLHMMAPKEYYHFLTTGELPEGVKAPKTKERKKPAKKDKTDIKDQNSDVTA